MFVHTYNSWTQNTLVFAHAQGLLAEVEILAKDLLKIDRSTRALRDTIKVLSPYDEIFFADVEKFVNSYVFGSILFVMTISGGRKLARDGAQLN